MASWSSLYDALVGTARSDSLGGRMRQRRWQMLSGRFPDLDRMHVLDLGGTAQSWQLAPVRPERVTLVNPADGSAARDDLPGWMEHVPGDACELPAAMQGRIWDLVFSNSVIEHVGGHHRCGRFAESVHRSAPAHWIQTPYRYFPVEPHWVFPGFQFLPAALRRVVAMRWPLHEGERTDPEAVLAEVLDIELLDRTRFTSYFPDSELLVERVLGLPKSLIAVSAGRG